jgi:hypothetical protein
MERILVNFLHAGSSALMLSLAYLFPEFWYVSLFALTPFLWRAIKTRLGDTIIMGSLLATAYFMVVSPLLSSGVFETLLLNLLGLNILFVLFGVIVNQSGKKIGLNAVLIAVLWLPLEYGLKTWTDFGLIFAISEANPVVLIKIGSLFGLLMISFVIVLVNTLILYFISFAINALTASENPFKGAKNNAITFTNDIFVFESQYFSHNGRAPPPWYGITF